MINKVVKVKVLAATDTLGTRVKATIYNRGWMASIVEARDYSITIGKQQASIADRLARESFMDVLAVEWVNVWGRNTGLDDLYVVRENGILPDIDYNASQWFLDNRKHTEKF